MRSLPLGFAFMKHIAPAFGVALVLCLLCPDVHPDPAELMSPPDALKWKGWIIPSNKSGNPAGVHVSLDEWEAYFKLREAAEGSGKEPRAWKVIYCLAESTDMVRFDDAGVAHVEKAMMTPQQKEFCVGAFEQFEGLVYAYSGGTMKIDAIRRELDTGFKGEYNGTTFFWPMDFIDLSTGFGRGEYDSVIGHFHAGPVRTPFSAGTIDASRWCRGMGQSSVMLDPSRETGSPISVLARDTLREWLKHTAAAQEKMGYYGMPDVSSLETYIRNAPLYYMRHIVPEGQWDVLSLRDDAPVSPNRPSTIDKGFIREWLVCGPFFSEEEVSLERDLPFEEGLLPDTGALTDGREWGVLVSAEPAIMLRDVSPVSRRGSFVFAHAYVFSDEDREVKLWLGGREPFSVRLNGERGIGIWEGAARDTVMRRMRLRAGWNRLLIKKQDQDSGDDWWFTARITGTDNGPIAALEYSAEKPESGIVEGESDWWVPLETPSFSWDDVKADPWGRLPVLSEQHLEKITGLDGMKIGTGRTSNFLFFEVPESDAIMSRTVRQPAEDDCRLNNELNFERETAALIRYKTPDGKPHDLLFLRIDMVEPYLDAIRGTAGEDENAVTVLGYVLRDRKPAIVVETHLGTVPLNEFDLLCSENEDLRIETRSSTDRIIRGEKFSMSFSIANIGKEIVDAGTLELRGFPDGSAVAAGNIYNLVPGERRTLVHEFDSASFQAGVLPLRAVIDYEVKGVSRVAEKPLPFEIRDAVSATLSPRASALIHDREFEIVLNLHNNTSTRQRGRVTLELPRRWQSRPSSIKFDLKDPEDSQRTILRIRRDKEATEGDYVISARVKLRDDEFPDTASVLHLRTASGRELLRYGFDRAIEGDFAVTEGHYKVGLSRQNPLSGPGCLEVADSGGSHYGHVWMFSERIFAGPSNRGGGSLFSFDTADYPIVDFGLRSRSANADIGLHVVLDDGEPGYLVMLSGEYDGALCPRKMIGRLGFVADGTWHRSAIDLDGLLDGYLGDIPHRVTGLKFGDTREMDFGWWTGSDRNKYFIDDFLIRKR